MCRKVMFPVNIKNMYLYLLEVIGGICSQEEEIQERWVKYLGSLQE